jgi:hypothetical protein
MTTGATYSVGREEQPATTYRLLLFVAGDEPNSRLAKENLAQLRDSIPEDRCAVEIIDVLEDYRPALEHNVLVTPCLLLLGPAPVVRIVGTLNDTRRVRAALRLPNG